MAVKIRLKRMGAIRSPFYRVVVMDSRTKRDGRAIEEIGLYHPTREPSVIEIDSERAQYWLGVGAQPTEQVLALLRVTGDWQKHKGEPGAEGTLKPQPTKPSKRDLYEAAMAAAGGADDVPKSGPTSARQKAAKPEAAKAETAKPETAKPEATEAPSAEAPDAPSAEAPDAPSAEAADAPEAEAAQPPSESAGQTEPTEA